MQSKEMDELNRRLDHIEKLLTANASDCEKMSNHIDFVERVYEYVKRPLFFVTDKLKRFASFHKVAVEYTPHQSETTDSG